MKSLVIFFRLIRPLFILGGFLFFALGVGIAKYLGNDIQWTAYLLGQSWVILLQLSTQLIREYYRNSVSQSNPNQKLFSTHGDPMDLGILSRRVSLIGGLTCFTLLASCTVVLLSQIDLSTSAIALMGIAFLGAFFFSMPSFNLSFSGYAELIASILVAFCIPAYAYLLQVGQYNRFVAMTAFPITLLYLSMMIVFEFPYYLNDIKYNQRTLLVRMGWDRGMALHNGLILVAYLLFAMAMFLGYPRFTMLPIFLPMPLGIFEIWQMRRILNGAKPNWSALKINAIALLGTTVYLLTFAFWTN